MAAEPTERPYDERSEVLTRRFHEARAAGLTRIEARNFAESDVDVGQLRKLVRGGCAPKTIAEIVT